MQQSSLLQAIPVGGSFTYQQRYYTCDEHWHKGPSAAKATGPIFFYVGNEADVTL